jgi:hypothetical protein
LKTAKLIGRPLPVPAQALRHPIELETHLVSC